MIEEAPSECEATPAYHRKAPLISIERSNSLEKVEIVEERQKPATSFTEAFNVDFMMKKMTSAPPPIKMKIIEEGASDAS